MIAALPKQCKNRNLGCIVNLDNDDLKEHEKKCDSEILSCCLDNCQYKTLRIPTMEVHFYRVHNAKPVRLVCEEQFSFTYTKAQKEIVTVIKNVDFHGADDFVLEVINILPCGIKIFTKQFAKSKGSSHYFVIKYEFIFMNWVSLPFIFSKMVYHPTIPVEDLTLDKVQLRLKGCDYSIIRNVQKLIPSSSSS